MVVLSYVLDPRLSVTLPVSSITSEAAVSIVANFDVHRHTTHNMDHDISVP